MDSVLKGGCLCGAVKFQTTVVPTWVGICHCNSCRKAIGGVVNGACGFPKTVINLKGKYLTYYVSSPGVRRGFCSKCGTSISYESDNWPEDIHLMIGAFDHPEALVPDFHIFTKDQLPWVNIPDDLVRYETTPSDGKIQQDT